MRELRQEPILTTTFESAQSFTPQRGSVYIYCCDDQTRSSHVSSWRASAEETRFIEIIEQSSSSFRTADREFFLRSRTLVDLVDTSAEGTVYLDITGITYPVWAALLRSLVRQVQDLRIVYVEPHEYTRSIAPVEGHIYDLSSTTAGIAPLPGYAVLANESSSDFLFIALLGFEGTRTKHILEQVQPGPRTTRPVVGSPGFKSWYVFDTYFGNRGPLLEEGLWQQVRYAAANCPFSSFYLISDFADTAPTMPVKIALIGTRPHAVGAVLFALARPAQTELIYDHPIRHPEATVGIDRLFVYHISAIFESALQSQVAG